MKNISTSGMAWVDIELINNYGSVLHTIEIESPTQGWARNTATNIKEANSLTHFTPIENIEIRNIQGQLIMQTKNYEDINQLPKGIYILTIKRYNVPIETKKIFL